ncbi:MAG: VOC family protein [Caulobacteraceae bacterium]|nr:VOC family protein [Caulobacteraceae bacterium]
MRAAPPAIVPELDVADLEASLAFYRDVMGFTVAAERLEEGFAYLVRDGAHLMLEQAAGPGRRFRTAALEYPFGRGVNLQIRVGDVDALRAAVEAAGLTVLIDLEERWYRQGEVELGNRQFVVADPNGYLLRPFTDLGVRKAGA